MKSSSDLGILFLATAAVLGCSGSRENRGATATAIAPLAGCDGIELAPPPSGQGKQFSIEIDLGPGEENEYCQYVMAGEALDVNSSEGLWTPGSHHARLDRTGYTDAFPTTTKGGATIDPSAPFHCNAPVDTDDRGAIRSPAERRSSPCTRPRSGSSRRWTCIRRRSR